MIWDLILFYLMGEIGFRKINKFSFLFCCMKNEIALVLSRETGFSVEEVLGLLEVPPKEEWGDFAFPCFGLAKKLRKSPTVIAEELAEKFRRDLPKGVSGVDFSGAYVNFFVDVKELAERVLSGGNRKLVIGNRKRKVMVEFPSANTNKPLHLGHVRNMAIGESVARILEFGGDEVVRANLNQDRGVHICKSMIGYEKFGKGKVPDKKSDHFVGDYYVKFNIEAKKNSDLEREALECLRKWEAGDKKTIALWKKMNRWAYKGWAETFRLFGIKHDVDFFESEIYEKGREIVEGGLKSGIFEKGVDGEIKVNLESEGLGEKVLLRSDGTSVYITQDLYLAMLKYKDFKLDENIYVVGNEQDYHFRVLGSVLKKLGFDKELCHLSYGMVRLPEGKLKSREGKIVDADDLIAETRELARVGLMRRGKMGKRELERRSLVLSLAAIKYIMLKQDIRKDMVFNPKEAIAFEGDTGPYLLYSYARAASILGKVKGRGSWVVSPELDVCEVRLLKKIDSFGEVVVKAYEGLAPNLVANYCFELASLFNEFYHSCPVIGSESEGFRVRLVEKFRDVLKEGLGLLGIETLEEM